jgi:RHS repeat-associated protein
MPKTLLPNCLIPSRQTCRPFSDWRRLGRGSGHKRSRVSNRRVEHDTAVLTDTWFHYDQVGSVLSESDASGNLVATHYQDAFGVRQADWETGLPGGVGEGWAHNTKELDGGTGLMYMYQRHYIPEYGQFMSRAPYEVVYEHEYGFAEQNPTAKSDPSGEIVWVIPIIVGGAILATGCGSSNSNQKTNNPCILLTFTPSVDTAERDLPMHGGSNP